MKQVFLFCLAILFKLTLLAQLFKKDDIVEVNPSLPDSLGAGWKQASFLDFDSVASMYHVKLADGSKITIPSKDPEKWIRPFVNKQELHKYGPGARITYEKRSAAMKNIKCGPSEIVVKRNIKSMMAGYFKDYPYIYVDFTSFKAQNGYDDKNFSGQQIYPYKIEMLVHLKRTLLMGGKQYTEYQTWEFDRVYEYATRPKNKCEFYALPSTDMKLLSRAWYDTPALSNNKLPFK